VRAELEGSFSRKVDGLFDLLFVLSSDILQIDRSKGKNQIG
jgi:hypothetical protein